MTSPDPFATPATLARSAWGVWLHPPPRAPAHGAAIDSRLVQPGQLFFALGGTRTDGHLHVRDAHTRGAYACVVERPVPARGGGLLLVENVQHAMVALARAWRLTLSARVIAVTGSSGKTTTTRLIAGVLGRAMSGSCSRRSHNNLLGVCLTLLNARSTDEFLVAEVGSSAPGEIAPLAHLLQPAVGVITSIGRAHTQGLGSIVGVAREKAALLEHLPGDGLAVIPAGSAPIDGHVRTDATLVRVGTCTPADVLVGRMRLGRTGVRFSIGDEAFSLAMLGTHNAINGAMALAVGRHLGLDADAIREGLMDAQAEPGRLELRPTGDLLVLDDCYNANPESMEAALRTLETLDHDGPRICVLGDMLELGELSVWAHQELGERLASSGFDLCVLVGERMRAGARALRSAGALHEVLASLEHPRAAQIAADLPGGSLVLVKGSRSMRLERFIAAIHNAGDRTGERARSVG